MRRTVTEGGLLTFQGKLLEVKEEDSVKIDDLMRRFQSAKRTAFKRLVEGGNKNKGLEKELVENFILNSEYARSAISDAKAIMDSQRELLPYYIANYEGKIRKSKKKLEKCRSELKQKGLFSRIKKYEEKRDLLKLYLENETIPRVIFGGRRNFELFIKGEITREEWRALRTNQVYSKGRAVGKGNNNLRVTYEGDGERNQFYLWINYPSKKVGKWGSKQKYKLFVPEPFKPYIIKSLETEEKEFGKKKKSKTCTKKAHTVRVIRRKGGEYYVFITVEVFCPEEALSNAKEKGLLGLDVNTKGIGAAIVLPNGNLRAHRWFPCHELLYVRNEKRSHLIGNLLVKVFRWAKGFGVNTVVSESFNRFKRDHDTYGKFNRATHNFCKEKMVRTIKSRAVKENFVHIEVFPAYSSIIGAIKYQKIYGLSTHEAAAFIIGRRGLGYNKERIPKEFSESLKPEGRRRWKDDVDPLASICRQWGGLWKQVSKIKNSFFETTREIPLNHRKFIRHLLIKASGADSALQLALSYLKKKGETEVEATKPLSRFRSYLDNLISLVLENAEELRENRSTRRKQSLCIVVDFINNKGFSTFTNLRSEENTPKGSKSLKRHIRAFKGGFRAAEVA
ncbi:MAG: hypothetical protein ACFE68_00235 [Candidatus Hodarchaeota archaeon]